MYLHVFVSPHINPRDWLNLPVESRELIRTGGSTWISQFSWKVCTTHERSTSSWHAINVCPSLLFSFLLLSLFIFSFLIIIVFSLPLLPTFHHEKNFSSLYLSLSLTSTLHLTPNLSLILSLYVTLILTLFPLFECQTFEVYVLHRSGTIHRVRTTTANSRPLPPREGTSSGHKGEWIHIIFFRSSICLSEQYFLNLACFFFFSAICWQFFPYKNTAKSVNFF